jgi:hypothetical protein
LLSTWYVHDDDDDDEAAFLCVLFKGALSNSDVVAYSDRIIRKKQKRTIISASSNDII